MIISHVIQLRSADIKDRSSLSHSMWFGYMVITEDTVWAINRKVMLELYMSSPKQYSSKAKMAWSTYGMVIQAESQAANESELS